MERWSPSKTRVCRRCHCRSLLSGFPVLALSHFFVPCITSSVPAGASADSTAGVRSGDTETRPDTPGANANTDAASSIPGFVPPKLLDEVTPVYPPEAFADNVEATVGLTLYIDEVGKVVKTEIAQPARDTRFEFDENAKAAFLRARFSPATQDGAPIAVKLRVDYQYKIDFKEPVVKAVVQADYPDIALRRGITDTIFAELDVDAEGAVTAVRITQPPAHSMYRFEAAALAALKQFRFDPATKNGIPVPVTVVYRYDFVLPETWVPPEKRPVNLIITLLERGTRVPVTSGVISIKRGDDPPIEETFDDGVYRGRGLPPGVYDVMIEADGYAPIQTQETVVAGKVVAASYLIERESYDVLDPSNSARTEGDYVYETRKSTLQKEISVTRLPVAEIQRVPGNNGDAVKVIQNLPGISRSAFSAGAVIVRGSAPADSAVLLDGTPLPMIYHFGGLASTVNSDCLDAIDFLPGNFSVKYGRAMGGVIDVRTRSPNRERYTGYLDLDTMDGTVMLEGPIAPNLSFFASARRSWFDTILKALLSKDTLEMTTAPRYWDFQARLDWSSKATEGEKPAVELELMAYGSDDALKMLDDSDVFKINMAFHHAKLGVGVNAGPLENWVRYDFGRNRSLFRDDNRREEKIVYTHAIRDDLTLHLTDWLDLMTGVDVHIEQYHLNINAPDRTAENLLNGELPDDTGQFGGRDPDDLAEDASDFIKQKEKGTRVLPAVHLAFGFHPIERAQLTVGGRLDYDSLSNDWSIDARGTGRLFALEYLALKGGVGTFHQPPEEKALSKAFGNPDLGMQNAVHFSIGTETRLPMYDPLSLEVTGFYKRLNDLVVPSDEQVERDGKIVRENYTNDGAGRVWGVEIMLRHLFYNNFFAWISYTLSRSERKDGDDRPWHLSKYDQTHILTLLGSYKLPKGFQLGLRFRYVTGTPYTPLSTGVFDSDADNYEPVAHKPYSVRTAAYHQLDLRIDKDWIFDYWIFTAYLDIQNVYFHANEELSHYSYDYAEREPIRGLPIQPSVGLRGAF